MGRHQIIFQPTADNHLTQLRKSGDQTIIKKIESIVQELSEHTGTGKPEKLKHELQGLWSRKINQKHRMVYDVKEDVVTVLVLSVMGHYSDK